MIDPTQVALARRALGRRLAAYRKAAGLSQHQLAPLTHYGRSTVANVEVGSQNVPREFWERCEQALKTDGALLRGYDELVALVQRQREELALMSTVGPHRQRRLLAAQPSTHTLLLQAARTSAHAILSAGLLAAVEDVRRGVDETLAEGTLPAQLDRFEETVDGHARDCTYTQPIDMLCRLTLDISQIRSLASGPQPPTAQHRLYRVEARLAALIADELTVLGDTYAAAAWHNTARIAADATNDLALRADVRALAAILPLYIGRPERVIDLARQAQTVARNTPCASTALAPLLEALGCAQLGDHDSATRALNVARHLFETTAPWQRAESIFGFSERRLRFYESRTLIFLGRHAEAWEVQDAATALYPAEVFGDPALIQLDRARSLAVRGDAVDACGLAERTLLQLPVNHRAPLFIGAGRHVWRMVRAGQRTLPAVRAYNELLASWETR